MSEVEETLKRIQSHRGVIGVITVNNEGIPIRTTMDNSTTVQYAGLIHELADKARSTVRDIDPTNDLTFLRIRSKKHEIMVAPDKEYNYVDHSPDLPRQLELVSQYNRRKRRAQQIKDFYSLYKKKHKLYIIFDN